VLRLQEVHAHYGAIHALKGVNMEVEEGQMAHSLTKVGRAVVPSVSEIDLTVE